MSEYTNERAIDSATDLNLIREQCGTLELALQTETDRLPTLERLRFGVIAIQWVR